MDLKELNAPLPKPWLTVNAGTVNATEAYIQSSLRDSGIAYFSASGNIPIDSAVSGVVVIRAGATPGLILTMPTNAVLSSYLNPEIPNGIYFTMLIINKSTANAQVLSPDSATLVNVPNAPAFGALTSVFVYSRFDNNWICNNL